jgi:TPR repeat protein
MPSLSEVQKLLFLLLVVAATQFDLVNMFKEAVKQSFEKPVKWYQPEAVQGDSQAQFNLGVAYDYGLGVKQDFKEAEKWYRLAAHQGHTGAQYNLPSRTTTGKTSGSHAGLHRYNGPIKKIGVNGVVSTGS